MIQKSSPIPIPTTVICNRFTFCVRAEMRFWNCAPAASLGGKSCNCSVILLEIRFISRMILIVAIMIEHCPVLNKKEFFVGQCV